MPILLVEQNLAAGPAGRPRRGRARRRRGRLHRAARRRCWRTTELTRSLLGVGHRHHREGGRPHEHRLILLTLTGLGLAGLYFLVASGLSLVFGLADVLNFAHGLFLSVGAYATWWAAANLPGAGAEGSGFVLAAGVGVVAGAVVAALVELVLIRPLYQRTIEQVLVTVGLSLAGVALLQAVWGADARPFPRPAWTPQVTPIGGASVPNSLAAADRRRAASCWPRCWPSCGSPGSAWSSGPASRTGPW